MKKELGLMRTLFLTVLASGMLFGLFGLTSAQAAVFVVDDTFADGDPDSLRDAIEQANAAAGRDTILLRPGRYVLTMGQLEIQQDLLIKGSGANRSIIDGGQQSRVFYITSTANANIKVNIQDVTITGGFVQAEDAYGGGIYNEGNLVINHSKITKNTSNAEITTCGGGLYNQGDLVINSTWITENTAKWGMDAGGGGICNRGNLSINNSSISKNVVRDSYSSGAGGIATSGDTTLTRTKVHGNMVVDSGISASGGGISCGDPDVSLTLINSQVTGNQAGGGEYSAWGGGIRSGCQLTLRRSQVKHNKVGSVIEAEGGGIYCTEKTVIQRSQIIGNTIHGVGVAYGGGIRCKGDTTIERSRIIGNSAEGLNISGGGISSRSSRLTISRSQINRNTLSGGGGQLQGGGIHMYSYGEDTVFNLTGSQVIGNMVICASTEGCFEPEEGGGIWLGNRVLHSLRRSIVRRNTPDQVFFQP